jgi:hypothetical protein
VRLSELLLLSKFRRPLHLSAWSGAYRYLYSNHSICVRRGCLR